MARRPPPRRQRVAGNPRTKATPKYDTQKSDPRASLRLWSVDIIAGDVLLTIPPRPAADWLEAVLSDDMSLLFDADSAGILEDMVLDGVDPAPIFRDAVAEISGRPWYVAMRLCAMWAEDQVRGEVWRVVDLASAPFAAVLDAIYAVIVRNLDHEKRATFEKSLAAEVIGIDGDPREAAKRAREFARERAQAIGMPSAVTPPRTPRSHLTPLPDDRSPEPTPQQ